MPWKIINRFLGDGLHWGKDRQRYLDGIAWAKANNRPDVLGHLLIALKLRDKITFDGPHPPIE